MCSVSPQQVITISIFRKTWCRAKLIFMFVLTVKLFSKASWFDTRVSGHEELLHSRTHQNSVILLIILSRPLFTLEKLQTKLLKLLHRHTRTSRAFVDKLDCVRQASTTIRSRTRDKTRLIENWSSHEVTQKAAGNRIVYPYWFTHT